MDWILVGVSVLTGIFGGKVYYGMAEKGKHQLNSNENDSQKTESHPSGANDRTKAAIVASKPPKDNQKNGNNSPKSGDNKQKKESDSSKKGDPKADPIDNKSAARRLKTTPYDPRFPNQNQTRFDDNYTFFDLILSSFVSTNYILIESEMKTLLPKLAISF